MNNNIGEKIKKRRQENNITQYELAEYIGKSRSLIAEIERGNVNVSKEIISKMSSLLNVPESYFEEEKEQLNPYFRIFDNDTTAITENDINIYNIEINKLNTLCDNYIKLLEIAYNGLDKTKALPTLIPIDNFIPINNMENYSMLIRAELKLNNDAIEDIISLLSNHYNIKFIFADFPEKIRGSVAIKKNDYAFIFLNRNVDKKYPFVTTYTACHEFAHLIFNRTKIMNSTNKSNNEDNASRINAEKFASFFLLPKESIRLDYQKSYFDKKSMFFYIYLSNKYKISRTAIAYRLCDLKLISNDEFKRIISIEEEKIKASSILGYDIVPYSNLHEINNLPREYFNIIVALLNRKLINTIDAANYLLMKENEIKTLII